MTGIPEPAALLYALTIALGAAIDAEAIHPTGRDIDGLIEQGRTLVANMSARREIPSSGRTSVYVRDAGAAFLREWARADPDRAADLLDAAESLEAGRDLALLTMPRADA